MTGSLDQRERGVALFAAALAAVSTAVLWTPHLDEPEGLAVAGVGVALAGLLALAARSGRRLPTGLAAVLLAFGPWGFAWVLGFPYLCLAAWLLFRHGRARSAPGADEGAEPSGQQERRPGRRPRREAKTAETRSRPAHPEPNKRYTPPQGRR